MNMFKSTTLMAAILFFAGCGEGAGNSEPAPDSATISEAPADSAAGLDAEAEVQTYDGTGIVRNITPSRTFIVIEHQAIDGFMGAMTMPFEIRDEALLEGIELETAVNFTLSVQGLDVFVSKLELVQE